MAVLLTLTMALAGPSVVWGAVWTREVRFPSGDANVVVYEGHFLNNGCPNGWDGGNFFNGGTYCNANNNSTAEVSGWLGASGPGGPNWVQPGHEYRIVSVAGQGAGAGSTPFEYTWGGPSTSGNGGTLYSVDATGFHVQPEIMLTAPATVAGQPTSRIRFQARWLFQIEYIRIEDTDAAGGGDCIGSPGAGSDGGLVWGAAGLTSVSGATQWGDQWIEDDEGCFFINTETYHYRPPEGIPEGSTFKFGAEMRGVASDQARVTITWARPGAGGGSGITAYNHTSTSPTTTALDAEFEVRNAPSGVSHFTIVVEEGTTLRGLYISNVEGDEILDPGDPAPGDGGGSEDYWADCEPPADVFDVPGWLEYGICVVQGGFTMVGDWIGDIAGDMAEVWNETVGPLLGGIAAAVGDAVGDVFMGLGDMLGDVLTALFVPSGNVWDDFMATLEGRAPFAWVDEVLGLLDEFGSAGPPAVVSATVLGSTVTLPLASFAGTVAPWRFAMAGAMWVLAAYAVWGTVRGAVGANDT